MFYSRSAVVGPAVCCYFLLEGVAVARVSAIAAVPTAEDNTFAAGVSFIFGILQYFASLLLFASLLWLAPFPVVIILVVTAVHIVVANASAVVVILRGMDRIEGT
jgi:hypothetical protein